MNKSEQLFFDKLVERGESPSFSSDKQNICDHIDILSNGVRYDVKDVKKLRRGDNEGDPDIIWLEMTNVRGNKGWLQGEADRIAFYNGKDFDVVDRKELLEFSRKLIDWDGFIVMEPLHKTPYQRENRKDLIAYIYRSEIKHLIKETI